MCHSVGCGTLAWSVRNIVLGGELLERRVLQELNVACYVDGAVFVLFVPGYSTMLVASAESPVIRV